MTRWLILVLALGAGAACGGDGSGEGAATAGSADRTNATTDAAATVDATVDGERSGVVYLDVRRPDEWAQGHVEGALHIPLSEIPARMAELEAHRDDEIVVYCRTGNRSGQAIRQLREAGFTNLVNGGGLTDMASSGVPTTR